MPKTYDTPDPKHDPEREPKTQKTVGVYGRPERTVSRGVIIAIVAIVAIVILFLLYRLAQGEKDHGLSEIATSGVQDHDLLLTPRR